jgi:hypothetical protein
VLLAVGAASPASARAQSGLPLRLDPTRAGEGTTLLIELEGTRLESGGRPAESLVALLPPGTRFDARARAARCTRSQARSGSCPAESRIGFGRLAASITGFLAPGGESELAWAIAVFLGEPLRAGDPASIVLRYELLGADRVAQLLGRSLEQLPQTVTVAGGRVDPSPTRFGLGLELAGLPAAVRARAPAVVTPARLELTIGAVRRVRRSLVRRVVVRTPQGRRVERVRDHELVGHDLLRAPSRCRRSWDSELRVSFPARPVERIRGSLFCLARGEPG